MDQIYFKKYKFKCMIIVNVTEPISPSLKLELDNGTCVQELRLVVKERVMVIPVDHFNVRLVIDGIWQE